MPNETAVVLASASRSGTVNSPKQFNGKAVGAIVVVDVSAVGAGTNEQQLVTLPDATGGTFTLTYSGQTTSGIAFDASAATVDAALEALSNIEAGDITVTGSAGGPWTVTFGGTLGATDVALMTASGASLTKTGGSVTASTSTPGVAAVNEQQTVTLNGSPTGGTFTLTYSGQTTSAIAYNASAADIKAALEALSNIDPDAITCTGSAGGPWTITFGGNLAATDIALLTSSAAGLTVQGGTVTPSVDTSGVVAVNEQQVVTINGSPPSGNFTLTYSGQTTANIAYNATAGTVQTALEGLVNIGAGQVSVAGSAGGPWTVTFTGTLAGTNVVEMTGTDVDMPGGSVSVATTVPGVVAVDEVQLVTLATATGGTFTLTFGGDTTSALAFNASSATVDAALEALTSIGAGNIAVTGSAGGPYTCTFGGTLAGTDVALMTASAAGLTVAGGSVAHAETVTGVAAVDEVQLVTLATATGGTFTLTFGGQTTSAIAYDASSATVDSALEALSSIGAGNIAATGSAGGPYTCTFGGTLAGADQAEMTSSAAGLTVVASAPTISTSVVGEAVTSVIAKIQGLVPGTADTWYDILTSAAITATGQTVLRVYPGLTPVTNLTVSDLLPPIWRVQVAGGLTDAATYAVSAGLMG